MNIIFNFFCILELINFFQMMVIKNANSFPYLDILIFGVIAIFLIFRLKSILGTKTDFEKQI